MGGPCICFQQRYPSCPRLQGKSFFVVFGTSIFSYSPGLNQVFPAQMIPNPLSSSSCVRPLIPFPVKEMVFFSFVCNSRFCDSFPSPPPGSCIRTPPGFHEMNSGSARYAHAVFVWVRGSRWRADWIVCLCIALGMCSGGGILV